MLDALSRNLRYSVWLLASAPGFTCVAILSLTAIFQLFDAIRLRTLRVKSPQELAEVRIEDRTEARGTWFRDNSLSNPLWEHIRDRQQVFSGAFAWASEPITFSQSGEDREIGGLWCCCRERGVRAPAFRQREPVGPAILRRIHANRTSDWI